jgi:hypothetical protein
MDMIIGGERACSSFLRRERRSGKRVLLELTPLQVI